jgi:hypothetical protein
MSSTALHLLVPLAPLAGAIVVGLFGDRLGRSLSHWLCILGVSVAFLASLIGMGLSFGDQFLVHRPPAGMDDPILPLCIIIVGLGLFFYARAMRSRGVLA